MTMPSTDTIVGLALVGSSVIFILVVGLLRAAGRTRPKTAAPAPAQPTLVPVRALTPDQYCMHTGCTRMWAHDRHGWRTCTEHNTSTMPVCKVCKVNPATEFGRTCTECHIRIRDHFDEFVDQALAIVANEPEPVDDLALWEREAGWSVS